MRWLWLVTCIAAHCPMWAQSPIRQAQAGAHVKLPAEDSIGTTPETGPLVMAGNRGIYLAAGGESRFRYFRFRNEDWGLATSDENGFVQLRTLAHADIHAGSRFRVFAQLQSSLSFSRQGTSAVDENPLDIHQLFTDCRIPGLPGLMIRLGRQEIMFGSQRLVSVRDGPNNRQAFDGIRVLQQKGPLSIHLLYTHYVHASKGYFDDALSDASRLWGVYVILKHHRFPDNIDAYYIGHSKIKSTFRDASGPELRHTLGTRLWSDNKAFRYDLEAAFQFGDIAGKTIQAWTLSANISRRISLEPLRPVLGIKAELISGDRKYGDSKLQTFHPLYPRGAYFGLAAIIGPANLADLHPSVTLNLYPDLEFTADYDLFWRLSIRDGIYGPNVALLHSGAGSGSSFIGNQLGCCLSYRSKPLLLSMEGTWFRPGAFLKDTGASRHMLLLVLSATIKF